MTDCILLKNKPKKDGYVRICINYKRYYAHRYYYELAHGVVPKGLEIDHLCDNRACINVEHLEAVPHKINMERSRNHNIPTGFCRNGHNLKEVGIYVNPTSGPCCVKCNRDGVRRWRARQKEKLAWITPDVMAAAEEAFKEKEKS